MDENDRAPRYGPDGMGYQPEDGGPMVFYSPFAAPPSDNEMLRQFATAAMQGMLADYTYRETGGPCADAAFHYAEAMMAELKQRTGGGK